MSQTYKLGKMEIKKQIMDYTVKSQDKVNNYKINKNSSSTKPSSNVLSPLEDYHWAKKANMSNLENITESAEAKKEELKDVIGPLIAEVTRPLIAEMKLLRESVDNKYNKLEDAISSQHQEVTEEIHKLEVSLTKQKRKGKY